jgi:hypothetical protein
MDKCKTAKEQEEKITLKEKKWEKWIYNNVKGEGFQEKIGYQKWKISSAPQQK